MSRSAAFLRFSALCTVCALLFLLAACGYNARTDVKETQTALASPSASGHKAGAIRIGVSMQGLQRPYIIRVRDRLLKLEQEYGGDIELEIMDGQEDAERQNAQIEGFITKNVDVIIFNPISYEDGELGVDMANRSGIPIVLLITSVGNSNKAQALAISDHRESARIQMDMVARYLNYSGNIAIIKGLKGVESEVLRTEGYKEKLEQYPGIKVIESQSANWSEEETEVIVENWIRLKDNIDAIVAQNDNMAKGAIKAVEAAGMQNKIAVFGIDGDINALYLVKEGKLKGTVYHNAILQADYAIKYAIALAKGEKVTSAAIPFQKVDIGNVDKFIMNEKKYS